MGSPAQEGKSAKDRKVSLWLQFNYNEVRQGISTFCSHTLKVKDNIRARC